MKILLDKVWNLNMVCQVRDRIIFDGRGFGVLRGLDIVWKVAFWWVKGGLLVAV